MTLPIYTKISWSSHLSMLHYFRASDCTSNHTMTLMEDTGAKHCGNDKEDVLRKELPYCTGEIDFIAAGKKRGKVFCFFH